MMQSALNEGHWGMKLNVVLNLDQKSEALWMMNFTNAFKNSKTKIQFNQLTIRVVNGEFYGQAVP